LEHKGELELSRDLVPVSKILAPETIDVSGRADDPNVRLGSLHVTITDAAGEVLDVGPLMAQPSAENNYTRQVYSGVVATMPIGAYTLFASYGGRLRGEFGTAQVEIRQKQTTEFRKQLATAYRKCLIHAQGPLGEAIVLATARIADGGRTPLVLANLDPDSERSIWLALGRVRIEVDAVGYERADIMVEVHKDPMSAYQHIIVKLGYAK
jgi:hypothetical protein